MPQGGAIWPWGHDLSKLGRGPLGNATCKISKLQVFWFILRRFLKFLFSKTAMPQGGANLTQGDMIWAILEEVH